MVLMDVIFIAAHSIVLLDDEVFTAEGGARVHRVQWFPHTGSGCQCP